MYTHDIHDKYGKANGAKKKPLLSFPRIYSSAIPRPERERRALERHVKAHSIRPWNSLA
jgi:hypothetical protein